MVYAVESEGKTRIFTAKDLKGALEFARLIFPDLPRKVREATEAEKKSMLETEERVLAGIKERERKNNA